MFLKRFLFSAMTATLLAGFASCSSDEDAPEMQDNEKDQVAYEMNFMLPDDYKTRAAASGNVGSDGLYTFSREIDRVWYSVYYNGAMLYNSEQALAPDAIKKGDAFTVLFKFHKDLDPTKIYIFFWAGNKQDNVNCGNQLTTSAINLNFENRCVTVDPKYMNGNNSAIQEYDSFAGYFQLSANANPSNYNMKVTLKRPFAQFHILTDELTFPGVSAAFPNGITVVPGFGKEAATTTNYTTNLVSPTTWFFDSSVSLNPAYKQNEYAFTLTNYEYTNRLSGNSPERVTFKGRLMDYLGCYYVFAPPVKTTLKSAASSGSTSAYGYFNLGMRKVGESMNAQQFAAVPLPAEGIKANERYVIYNHVNTGDGDGGNGGGGFLSNNYAFEIVTAPGWDNTTEVVK